jgi:hypothetical protein
VIFGGRQWFTGKAEGEFLEILPVIPAHVTRIAEDDLGIIPISAMVGLHLGLEIIAFVKRIPAQMIAPGKAFAGETYTQFSSDLQWIMLLAPDNRPDMGLTDTDDPVIATTGFVAVHGPLLVMEVLNDPVTTHQPVREGDTGAHLAR